MSIELYVFMQDSRVPSRADWQRAIEQLGFPTVLDPSLNVRRDTGYSPTVYGGKSAGFEFSLDATADVASAYPSIGSAIGNRDKCATFRWGGDVAECAAALSAAAALAKLSDGVYFYPDDNLVYRADDAVEATRKDLASIRV